MNLLNKKNKVLDYLQLTLGTAITAFAIKSIFDPVKLVTGGVSGVAIIIKNLTLPYMESGIPLWLTSTVLNIPLFIAAIKIKGWKFMAQTTYATVLLSFFLWLLPDIALVQDDLVLASIFGGVISGIGMGLVLGTMATTGGTDLLAALIQRFFKHYSVAQIMQVVDGAIVLLGAWIFGLNYALYAVIAVFIVSKISDGIIEGVKFAKQAFIVSKHTDEIASAIMNELERGVTGLRAFGMYSNQEKMVLFCVVSKKEIVQLKDIVAQIDPEAFITVSDVREVLGEGFIEYRQ